MGRFASVLGLIAIVAVAYICSENRKKIPWRSVWLGLLLQFVFAVAILGIPSLGVPGVFRFVFDFLNDLVNQLVSVTDAGADFVFGPLGKPGSSTGFIFAFRALPTIIFFSSLTAVLYHLRILQKVVRAISWVMERTFKSSGAESLSCAANIFLGQTEAPLLVRPYLAGMTRSEIFCVMVAGMGTVAAGVMAAYVELLKGRISDIAGHLLTASVMAAPASILLSKMLVPETGTPETANGAAMDDKAIDSNVIESASRGAAEGLQLALNVAGMLIAFIALVALMDNILGSVSTRLFGLAQPLNFSMIMGWVSAPIAWLIGIPWEECSKVGQLLGEKVILNEFVAYVHLAKFGQELSDRSVIITSYALCGFANLSSIGIQIAGIGTLAPNQRENLSRLGLLAVLGGSLACFMIAAIAGLLY